LPCITSPSYIRELGREREEWKVERARVERERQEERRRYIALL
jgi:hypothetical protein